MSSTADKPAPAIDAATSPFGAPARPVQEMAVADLNAMYLAKCGLDIREFCAGATTIRLFECGATGMRYWRPVEIAGNARFYGLLQAQWPDYYKEERWEYDAAREAIGRDKRVLEVGCGRGFFLRSLEARGIDGVGLELNPQAIAQKVTRFDVHEALLGPALPDQRGSFDAVCSFQVLEHVTDPSGFIRDAVQMLRPGGVLVLSTPNYAHPAFRDMQDAFDLPPHHLNHFTDETYRRIAQLYGLEVVEILSQPMSGPRWSVPVDYQAPGWSTLHRRAANKALRSLGGSVEEPGHTIIAVLRLPQR